LENNDTIDLREYVSVIKKRRKTIIIVVLAALFCSLMVSLRAPKLYEASVVFMIAASPAIKADLTGKIETYDMPTLSVATYNKIITSPFLAVKVIAELSNQDSSFGTLTPEELVRMIHLKSLPDSSLMELSVRYISREGAVKIANTLASLFIQETGTLGDTQHTQREFVDKLKVWKSNLENAENNLRKFNATSNLEVWEIKSKDLSFAVTNTEESIRFLSSAIKENEELLVQIETQMKEQQPKLVTNKSITDDQFLQQLSKDITKEQAAKLSNLKVSSEELNPVYLNLMQRKVDLTLQVSNDKQKLAGYKEGLKNLNKDLTAANKEFSAAKIKQSQLIQEVDLAKDTYKLISQKNDELSIRYTKDPGLVKIVREAYALPFPVSPRVKMITLVWALIGLFAGGVLALLQEYFSLNGK
jgi:polysaccharide biosynthesis transport protein